MPETQEIVINTSPIIAIVAALGDLRVLQIYRFPCGKQSIACKHTVFG